MIYFWAFVVGGLICVIGQIMFDVFKLTPAHTLSTFVVIGAVLDGFGLYEPFIDFAGAQALVIHLFMVPWRKLKSMVWSVFYQECLKLPVQVYPQQ